MRIITNVKTIDGKIALETRLDPSSRDTKAERMAGEMLHAHLERFFGELERQSCAPVAPVKLSRWERVKAVFGRRVK